MGVWYKKYLQVYERPFAEAPQAVVEEVRQKIAGLQSENPVVTVSLIGYNEETSAGLSVVAERDAVQISPRDHRGG